MGALELRNKLIEQFNEFIQDDSKLVSLEGVFDAMDNSESSSLVSDEHYDLVKERRLRYHSGETNGLSWNEVKKNLKSKYGF